MFTCYDLHYSFAVSVALIAAPSPVSGSSISKPQQILHVVVVVAGSSLTAPQIPSYHSSASLL
jgi:hypothetical protein